MKKSKYLGLYLSIVLFLVLSGILFIIFKNYFNSPNNPKTKINNQEVDDYLYLLSYDNFGNREDVLTQVGQTQFDLVVMDTFYQGTSSWTRAEIENMKNSSGGNKIIVSYISIGEAEDYRYYWDENWNVTPPTWLDSANPDWPGCYKVHYWEQEWQNIVYDYLENYTLQGGFDGIFLDTVDSFEYYEEEENMTTASQLMAEFLSDISEFCRSYTNNSEFLIIPQNGESLHEYAGYLQAISGLAKEDVFYNDDEKNNQIEIDFILNHIEVFQQSDKFILLTEYCREVSHIDDFYDLAYQHNFIPYATTRPLDSIIINSGYEPD